MTAQLNLKFDRSDQAMTAALAKADRVTAGLWSARAHELLARFLVAHPGEFLTEDFVTWATWRGLPVVAEPRAIGGIIRAAAKAGVIVRVGYRADRWNSIKAVWATESRHD